MFQVKTFLKALKAEITHITVRNLFFTLIFLLVEWITTFCVLLSNDPLRDIVFCSLLALGSCTVTAILLYLIHFLEDHWPHSKRI